MSIKLDFIDTSVDHVVAIDMTRPDFRPDVPFDDLPLLPPAVELETQAVLKACIPARAALAELSAATGLIPNAAILINTIPILEAQASSAVENIVTTTDRLFQLASDERAASDPATKEALRYRTALRRGHAMLDRRAVSTNMAIEICTALRGIDTGIRRMPGTALRNAGTGETVYTPPTGEELLRSLLANWETFLNERRDLDPLVRMAVGHYQFEAIHPFEDGNGRTGRILNLLFLVEQGLLRLPVLYLSGAIIRSKAEYYRRLREVTTEDRWQEWVCYVLGLVERTSRWTSTKIHDIRELQESTASRLRDRAPKIYSRELVDVVFMQPYCRIANVVDAGIAKRQTASTYLTVLSEIGVLTPVSAGRDRLFINQPLLDLLRPGTLDGPQGGDTLGPATGSAGSR